MTTSIATWFLGGLVRDLPMGVKLAILMLAGLSLLMTDLGILTLRLPESRWQIPQTAFSHGPLRGALHFGFVLGTSVRTRSTSGAPYFVLIAILLAVETLGLASAVGASFGAGRAALPVSRYFSRGGESWDNALSAALPWLVPLATAVTSVAITWALLNQ